MDRSEIKKIVDEFLIEEIEIDKEAICDDALLKEDLGIDSLDFVDIVVIVERNFGFKINPEELSKVTTLSQFYDYIQTKIKK